jgi:hypothetical protein
VKELVQKSRSKFRAERNISEDTYVFYVDAGSNAHEVKFSFKSFKDGFGEFFKADAVSGVSKSHFEILVSLPSDVLIVECRALRLMLRESLATCPAT